MSQDKRQFTASVQPGTVDTLDDYAERENLNRSQAVTRVTEEWAELTDEGRVPIELIQAEPEQALPGETTAAAETAEAARETALTTLHRGAQGVALGAGLLLQWFVFVVPVWVAAPLAGVGVVLAALGLLNSVAGGYGVLDAYTNAVGATGATDDTTDSDTANTAGDGR
jgi:hypothetical protein